MGFGLVTKTEFRTSAEWTTLRVLTWARINVPSTQPSSFRSAYFRSVVFELRSCMVGSWSRLRIFNSVAVFSPHRERRWIFVDTISGDVIISRSRGKCFAERVGFGFGTHGDFGSRFGVGEVVVSGSGPLVEFATVAGCSADSG